MKLIGSVSKLTLIGLVLSITSGCSLCVLVDQYSIVVLSLTLQWYGCVFCKRFCSVLVALFFSFGLKSIRFKYALFFPTMRKPLSWELVLLRWHGFHMISKKSTHLKRMDFRSIFLIRVLILFLRRRNILVNWSRFSNVIG